MDADKSFPHKPFNESAAANIKLSGGALCLDFTNTVSNRGNEGESDYLADYDDLLAWSLHAGTLQEEEALRLAAHARQTPDAAQAMLWRARALREATFRTFAASAQGTRAAASDLAVLNFELAAAMTNLRLLPHDGHFDLDWEAARTSLERPLWPVARSVAELLTSGELARVHKCASANCGWLFVDRSKNHSRRWCDMKECGNVAKVRRYRTRHKAE